MSTLDEQVAEAVARIQREGAVPAAPKPLDAQVVAGLIDHTLLKPDATSAQVQALCAEAAEFGFASVCVNPVWAPLCVDVLTGSPVRTCAVAAFPFGATLPAVKAYEARQLVSLGVNEVDMVINIGKLRDGDYRLVLEDIAGVADECHEGGALLKVIIETAALNLEQKIAACVISREAGADFVKTSTGYGGGGATAEDVALMRKVVGPELGVKASGGVSKVPAVFAMVAAGATRIGTSGGANIMRELLGQGVQGSESGKPY